MASPYVYARLAQLAPLISAVSAALPCCQRPADSGTRRHLPAACQPLSFQMLFETV